MRSPSPVGLGDIHVVCYIPSVCWHGRGWLAKRSASYHRRVIGVEPQRQRDPDRSRIAISDAAEALFSERGYQGASLNEIALAAGLSRAAPSYFFGSKESLYVAVLGRLFAERQEAARSAFVKVHRWVDEGQHTRSLREALRAAVDGYMRFLLQRPAFARLLQWEDLSGGEALRVTPREPNAMRDGFEALARVAPERQIRRFDVDDALFVFISLTFSPITQRNTFMAVLGRDLDDPKVRRRHVRLVVDELMYIVTGRP